MKRLFGMVIFVLCMVVLGSSAQTQFVPLTVSPGSETGVAVVRQDCPTFSWTAVDGALGYRVAVFQAFGAEVASYEEMAALGAPLLSKEIPGRASSWTPSSEERLSSGSTYVWYVEALDSSGQGMWSKGKMFRVEAVGLSSGVSERVRKTLKEKGVSDEEIDDLFRDTASGQQSGIPTGRTLGSGARIFGDLGIQGVEGATNTFYGQGAGGSTTTGVYNTSIGAWAGSSSTSGNYNTLLGYSAGGLNTTGFSNTFLGYASGIYNTTGYHNTFLGFQSGYSNTTGYFNTFLGHNAGYANTTGYQNTFIGREAGFSNTTGYSNIFLGHAAGYYNTEGFSNIFIGFCAGRSNTSGTDNVFMGDSAGYANTLGDCNVFMGYGAGFNSTGSYNVFMGYDTGLANSSGSHNIFLGYAAGYNETGSEKLYIDSSETSKPLIYGDFSTDYLIFNGKVRIDFPVTSTAPTHMLDVGAAGAYCDGGQWVDGSSREYKEHIEELTTEKAMKAIRELEPVEFNYKADKEEKSLGFIAEDVPELVATKDRKGLSSMDVVAVLTKVVQEQQKMNDAQQKTIDQLREQVAELKKKAKSEK